MSVQVLPLQTTLVSWPWAIAAAPPAIRPAPTIVRIFPVLLQCRWGAGGWLDVSVPASNETFRLGMPARNADAGGNSLGETKSAAEAGKHMPNIATTRSVAKQRFVIK
jgi:hypothetical protein